MVNGSNLISQYYFMVWLPVKLISSDYFLKGEYNHVKRPTPYFYNVSYVSSSHYQVYVHIFWDAPLQESVDSGKLSIPVLRYWDRCFSCIHKTSYHLGKVDISGWSSACSFPCAYSLCGVLVKVINYRWVKNANGTSAQY